MDSKVSPETPNRALIDKTLSVIRIVAVCSTAVGIGSVICGILTLVFSDPNWDFPYSSGSGIWAGLIVLAMGLVGLNLTRIHGRSSSPFAKWVYAFSGLCYSLSSVGGLHFGYSISALVQCLARTERDDGREKCNADEHDNLVIVSAFGIAFGAYMLCSAWFVIMYLYRNGRGRALTGNPNYGRCCC